jgi:hypothetical protein
MRGRLTQAEYAQECERVADVLRDSEGAHLQAFLAAWEWAK